MHESRKRWIVATLWMLLFGVCAQATPILVQWEDGLTNPFSNWVSSEAPDFGILGDQTLGAATLLLTGDEGDGTLVGGNANALSIAGDRVDFGTDLYYTTGFGTVDLNDFAGFSFDFYAPDNDEIGQLGFYFRSTANSTVWFYEINPLGMFSGSWVNFSGIFDNSGGDWLGFTDASGTYNSIDAGYVASFSAALGTVTEIGFFIGADGGAGQGYGIDDFGLTVPEPETYLALGMALLTVALVFRRNISQSLAEARAMMLS